MPGCLGIYVEENLIKYAKISKERETIKVEAFGLKFYDNFEETLKQIVSETFSFKTPISINISDEKYTYSDLFSLLNKKDLEKAVNTEFELFCNDNGKNKNAIEVRHMQVENFENKDKTTILYSYCDKSSIVSKMQMLDGLRVEAIEPLPISLYSLAKFQNVQNSIILNIENETSITTVINGKIFRVDAIDLGMKEILNNINLKENSYQKSYEICKNSTIYTLSSKNLQTEENDYMEDIMPILYSIVEKTKDLIKQNGQEIQNIYLTGLASAINNIDLYFQENFPNKNCEILTPYFAEKSNLKLNIKDYIEVNSAIALALQTLNDGPKQMNFKKTSSLSNISKLLTIEVGGNKKQSGNKKSIDLKEILKIDFSSRLDIIEKNLIRAAVGILLIIIVYITGEKILVGNIAKKQKQMQDVVDNANNQISAVTNYSKLIGTRAEEYKSLVTKIDDANNKLTASYASKNAIPNFLTRLMFNMPNNVQLLSIKNTTGKTIEIQAQAEKYEQLGYLKATLKNSGILSDVTSTAGTKQNGIVQVTITGNLPY